MSEIDDKINSILSSPEDMEKILANNQLMKVCPKLAVIACDILDEMI